MRAVQAWQALLAPHRPPRCRGERGVHPVKQQVHAKRHILNPAVDEEGRRTSTATFPSTLHVLPNSLEVDTIVHLGGVARQVQTERFGIAVKLLDLEVRLMVEQEIVHGPELGLCRRALCSLRGVQGMRMNLFQRKVTIDEPDAPGEAGKQQLDRRCSLLAIGALEVAVFDNGHGGVRRADHMIGRSHGRRQFNSVGSVHEFLMTRSRQFFVSRNTIPRAAKPYPVSVIGWQRVPALRSLDGMRFWHRRIREVDFNAPWTWSTF
jgi:hypothetical protein